MNLTGRMIRGLVLIGHDQPGHVGLATVKALRRRGLVSKAGRRLTLGGEAAVALLERLMGLHPDILSLEMGHWRQIAGRMASTGTAATTRLHLLSRHLLISHGLDLVFDERAMTWKPRTESTPACSDRSEKAS